MGAASVVVLVLIFGAFALWKISAEMARQRMADEVNKDTADEQQRMVDHANQVRADDSKPDDFL